MQPNEVGLVKLFAGVLYTDNELLLQAKSMLVGKYGPIDFESDIFDFTISEYYRAEMGWPIERIFWSFETLINPKQIAKIKIECNEIENQIAVVRNRKINLDPGYMDYNKIVLASAKYNGQKVYLDFGIYADLTMHYEKGKFYPYPWSFPDFKGDAYDATFLRIREIFKLQRKQG